LRLAIRCRGDVTSHGEGGEGRLDAERPAKVRQETPCAELSAAAQASLDLSAVCAASRMDRAEVAKRLGDAMEGHGGLLHQH
jgi:hypothetical protein